MRCRSLFIENVRGQAFCIKVPLDLECFFEHSKKPSKEQTHSKKHSWEQIHFFESSKKCSKKFHWSKECSKKCSCEWSTQKSAQKRVGYSKKFSLSRPLKKGLIWVEPPKKMLKKVGCTKNSTYLSDGPASLWSSDHQRFLSCISGDEGLCFFSKGSQWMDWS